MASKLDQSLDEIAGARRGGPRRRSARKPAPAVAGGITKKTAPKPVKGTKGAPASTPAFPPRGDSKVIVSNLPEDVTEQQIKEYFASTVGPVKKVLLNYTKTGRSTGVANIIFSQPNSAAEAAKSYNGVKVDGKPMKIEVVMGAQYVPEPPAPKTLKDRIATPKSAAAKPNAAKPKPATNGNGKGKGPNAAPNAGPGGARGPKNARGRKGPRPKKTAEELDAEMADYWVDPSKTTAAPATNGAGPEAAAPNGGEAAMEDEIM